MRDLIEAPSAVVALLCAGFVERLLGRVRYEARWAVDVFTADHWIVQPLPLTHPI